MRPKILLASVPRSGVDNPAKVVMNPRRLSSGELARLAGVNPETIRYYERRDLLPRPSRTESGHRRYDPEAVSLLRLIKRAQDLGFTLAEIRDLLRGLERPQAVCNDVCEVLDGKIGQVDQELANLKARRQRLARLRAACPKTLPLRECPVIAELKDPRPERRERK